MFESDVEDIAQRASTGDLPPLERVVTALREAHERYALHDDGEVADYIPSLASAQSSLWGLALTSRDGVELNVGDAQVRFSIQSISKAFVFALVCDVVGHLAAHDAVGVNNTGLPFDSVMAIELNAGSPMNPMVNAGAIATTALVPGASAAARWARIHETLSAFAGRELRLNDEVYRSESLTNHRNRAIARLLESYGKLDVDPLETVDVYTRQCSLDVDTRDLATMGATLAAGGVNPLTGQRVISAEACRDTLTVLASCGMYERSGEWLFEIGLPAKSGVSGGIVAVVPGKGALGTYSPPLDSAGNSVRGARACAYLSRSLGLNLFASLAA